MKQMDTIYLWNKPPVVNENWGKFVELCGEGGMLTEDTGLEESCGRKS